MIIGFEMLCNLGKLGWSDQRLNINEGFGETDIKARVTL